MIQVVQGADQEVSLDSTRIVTMGETSEKFWKRFNGAISSGISYSKGNQSTQYNLAALEISPRALERRCEL